MTNEEFIKAKIVIEKIEDNAKRINDLTKLLDRMREITPEVAQNVTIQLGEQYAFTPQANVSKKEFDEFIHCEIEKLQIERKKLKDELAGI